MKNEKREYPHFALCGLSCGLCPMYHISENDHCPGCGRPSCVYVKCAKEHGKVEYCGLCPDYPCEKYTKAEPYDSFITCRSVQRDFERLRRDGIEVFRTVLDEKVEILRFLLREYNDGRRKSFFCLAVNLLELEDIKTVKNELEENYDENAPLRERGAQAAGLFRTMADKRGIVLKLNRKK